MIDLNNGLDKQHSGNSFHAIFLISAFE